MKKMILFVLALTMMGSMQAQEIISLPQPEVSKLSMTLGDALLQRRSERQYSNKEISLQTLSTLLWAACGISDQRKESQQPDRNRTHQRQCTNDD